MSARKLLSLLLLVALATSAARAAEPAPGKQTRLPCKKNASYTYDLYVPKAYAENAEKKFPVLFLSSPGANPGFMSLENWAEKNGVLLVGINDSKNEIPFKTIFEIQDDVIQTVEATLRLHPCLRFSIGFSGAGWASMHMADRYPDKHAGVVMMGHSANGTMCAKHISVAFIHGEKDETHPVSAALGAYQAFKSRGNPVRKIIVPGRGHQPGTREEMETMLNWMLGWQRLVHPKLPPKDRADAMAELKKRIEECPKIQSAAARLEEAQLLFDLPDIDKSPSYRTLAGAWFSGRLELAQSRNDPVEKLYDLLQTQDDPRARQCPAAELQKLTAELNELRKQPALKKEYDAYVVYDRIVKMEAEAGKNQTRLKQAQAAYEAFGKQFPDTKAAKLAAEAAQRMAKPK